VLKFIEDNWFTGRIGDSSFDTRAAGCGTFQLLVAASRKA